MFFQELSPPKKPVNPPKVEKKEETEEVTVVSLAPFTHNPKVCFEDVPVGATVTKKLLIRNPTKFDVELFITKGPPDERDVCYTWVQKVVPSENSVYLELTWSPKQAGSWRDIITFQDGNRIKKDIPVIFKSVTPKLQKMKNKSKKSIKAISAKIKPMTGHMKSPAKKQMPTFKTSPLKRRLSPPRARISPAKAYKPKPQKTPEKIQSASKKSPMKTNYSPRKELPVQNILHPSERRQTFNVHNKENVPNSTFTFEHEFLSQQEEMFEDSLDEIKSTPLHSTVNRIEAFRFSPDPRTLVKFDDVVLTPITDNFNPSKCSTGERSRLDATYDCKLKHNTSRGTYVKSPDSLANISGETFIKSQDVSGTHLKAADHNLSGGTYVKTEASSPGGTYVKQNEGVGNYFLKDLEEDSAEGEFSKPLPPTFIPLSGRCLDKIMEESYQGSDFEESYSIQTNVKGKSTKEFAGSSMILSGKQGNFSEIGVTPVKRKTIKSGLNLKDFIEKQRALKASAESIILHNPDEHLKMNLQNPYLLATTGDVDPFLSATSYYEPRWLDEQEIRFKKWLNVILTPPEGLRTETDSHPVNIAKIWQECKKCEVEKAPTKEEMSNKMAVRGTLDKLRATAVELFRSYEISQVLSKLAVLVENGKLSIRTDRNVHLDLGLQQEVMVLFLSYNPLWLRIGLETVFGRTLKLHSNSDIMGISFFIMSNFFKDAYLLKKYKFSRDDKYTLEIKKHILKKFLMLIYFLDFAKEYRMIQYDPCLFCKNAPFKESKEVLYKFTSLLLSAVGDIKVLKQIGFILNHKQTYIHEFDYAVNSLGVDLRDGVRLTRVMEVILLRQNLIQMMRVPAISRLQKIHNVKVAFTALQEADYMIQQDITPKDIVDGHREKTLSLLWQIIYKFEAPLVKKSIVTIQKWWNSLSIILKRRVLKRKYQQRVNAANKIQSYYKGWKLMQLERANYLNIVNAVHILQSWFRSKLEMLRVRRDFLAKSKAAIIIQRKFRANKIGTEQRKLYLSQKHAAVLIQRRFRATLLMNQIRQNYLNYRESIIKIQIFYRARLAMQVERHKYLLIKKSVVTIENWWISLKLMLKQRADYEELKRIVIITQTRFRAVSKMRVERVKFTKIKEAVILIQQLYTAKKLMRAVREDYIKKRLSVLVIQNRFRGYKLMKIAREEFLLLRNSAIKIQKYYKGYLLMKRERSEFNSLRKAALFVDEKRKAQIEARAARESFLKLKEAVIFIQRKFRANCACKNQRAKYESERLAIIKIQVWFRSLLTMRQCLEDYEMKKIAIVVIQRYFRGWLEVRKQVEIRKMKLHVIVGLQQYIRGFLARKAFRELTDPETVLKRKMIKAAIIIQATWRGYAVRMSESNEIGAIRKRYGGVSKELSTQKSIGNKKEEALKVLKNEKSSYLQIVSALEHIEYITRVHKESCLSLSEILPDIIAELITTSGRSDPDRIACIRGANILINFIKYSPSSKNAWLPDHINGIIKTMTHWCDKESDVFPLLCTIIWLYTQNKTYLRIIKSKPNLKQMFGKILQLCERKQKMMSVARRNPSGNVQFCSYKNLPLPSLMPDWGLDHKTEPRSFSNSIHAIKTLMAVLNLN